MSESKLGLSSFANPPVGEVVLSCQFDPLVKLQAVHFGLFWEAIRSEYPLVETHPPIEPAREIFDEKPSTRAEIRFELAAVPAVPRVWYLNNDKTQLIQLQQDRLICNWRRVKDDDVYPRYETVRERFESAWNKLLAFLEREDLGHIVPNQCEVTYINQIQSGNSWSDHSEPEKILVSWVTPPTCGVLSESEGVRVAMRFKIRDGGSPEPRVIGRLHVDFHPAFRSSDTKPIYVLNLTARGIPLGGGVQGALKFFDTARVHIVTGFTELTKSELHMEWGRHGSNH